MTKNNCLRKWMKSTAVNSIFTALDNKARFVGGAVRDAVLNIDAKDVDITTPFHPDDVTARLISAGIKVIPTGIKHGTVTAVTGEGDFEITTLRRDLEHTGRHATVEFTDNWEEDAARRDFTINAMSCNQDGDIFDYFGGLKDIESGHLRFVGDAKERCREDFLRILRFFRFFAYYGKPPVDVDALSACKAEAGGVEGLSGERIQAEMLKLLAAPMPIFSLGLMLENGVMGFVIPEISEADIVVLEKLIAIADASLEDPLLRLAALLGDKLETAQAISKRWKLSNIDKNRLLFLCNPDHSIPKNCPEKIAKKLLRAWGKENFLDACHLAFARGLNKENYSKLIALKDWKIPNFPLAGKDLKSIGLSEGKQMGTALSEAESWWEENDYQPDKKALLEYTKLHSAN